MLNSGDISPAKRKKLLAFANQTESLLEGLTAHNMLGLPGVYNPYMLDFVKYKSEHDTRDNCFWPCLHGDQNDKTYGCHYTKRWEFVHKYSFAIPTQEAINKIVSFSGGKILEVGPGTGYWAWLLAQAGAAVIAVDKAPIGMDEENDWKFNMSHYPVEKGNGVKATAKYTPEYTLFLCWPPMDSTAYDCLSSSNGDKAIYIGESSGGCTADDDFFSLCGEDHFEEDESISALWQVEEEIYLPQWPGTHDNLYLLSKR